MCGHGCGGLVVIHGDAYQFGPGAGEGCYLLHGRRNVGGVGISHRLHHNWCIGADAHTAHDGRGGLSALDMGHMGSFILSRALG